MFKSVFILATLLVLSSSVFAQSTNIKGSTTCYMFKNDKLQKQGKCTFNGIADYAGSGGSHTATFYMQGNKTPIKVHLSGTFDSQDEWEYLLNGKPSENFMRLKSSFKKTTDEQTKAFLNEDNGIKKMMSCLQDKKTKQEFCYSADDFGNF